MKLTKKVSIKSFSIWIIAVTTFLAIGPYFQWSSFAGGVIVHIYNVLTLIYTLVLLYFCWSGKISLASFIACATMIFIYFFLMLCTGVVGGTCLPPAIGTAVTFFTFSLLLMCPHEIIYKSFDLLKSIYTIIIAITLILFLLVISGVPLPSVRLESPETGRVAYSGQYYRNYLGCLFMFTKYARVDRFISVFSEPGVVGTLSAFFLSSSEDRIFKDRRNIIILIGGIMSFSVAFVVMMAIFYVVRQIQKGVIRRALPMMLLVILYFAFININFDNPLINEFQQRLQFTTEGLAGDNRIKAYAQLQYNDFLHSDLETVLLGYGNAYTDTSTNLNFWQGSATYKRQVFQFGVIGFGMYVAWTILAPYNVLKKIDAAKNKRLIAYIFIFVLSMYQRPYPTKLFFLYLLIAGCVYVIHDKEEFQC